MSVYDGYERHPVAVVVLSPAQVGNWDLVCSLRSRWPRLRIVLVESGVDTASGRRCLLGTAGNALPHGPYSR